MLALNWPSVSWSTLAVCCFASLLPIRQSLIRSILQCWGNGSGLRLSCSWQVLCTARDRSRCLLMSMCFWDPFATSRSIFWWATDSLLPVVCTFSTQASTISKISPLQSSSHSSTGKAYCLFDLLSSSVLGTTASATSHQLDVLMQVRALLCASQGTNWNVSAARSAQAVPLYQCNSSKCTWKTRLYSPGRHCVPWFASFAPTCPCPQAPQGSPPCLSPAISASLRTHPQLSCPRACSLAGTSDVRSPVWAVSWRHASHCA